MAHGQRSADSTLLGVTMSKALKARIKAAADKEKRTMANWCAYHLERLLDEMEEKPEASSVQNEKNLLVSQGIMPRHGKRAQ